jgi:hypothetical protein
MGRPQLLGWPDEDELEFQRAAQHIRKYLAAESFTKVSFERIRKNINQHYTDDFLLRMIDEMTQQFRRANLSGQKTGLEVFGDSETYFWTERLTYEPAHVGNREGGVPRQAACRLSAARTHAI